MGRSASPIREFFPKAPMRGLRADAGTRGDCFSFIPHSSRFADGSEVTGLGIASWPYITILTRPLIRIPRPKKEDGICFGHCL